MSRLYAQGTSVPVGNTRNEIENMLVRRGARAFMFGAQPGSALLMFEPCLSGSHPRSA